MKKKGIIISIIALLAVIVTTIVISKNNQKYVMQDGMMLALTLDGNNVTSFPTGGNYHVDIKCDGGNGKYQPVRVLDSQGLETDTYEMKFTVEDIISSSVKCNVDFITITDTNKADYLLTAEIANKNTISTTNSGICSNEKYTTSSTCTTGGGYWYHVDSTTGSSNEDAGIRYSGKQPNNWVWFNNETWRIIGSIPVKQSDGTTSNLVKIIRNESIGGYAYDAKLSDYTGTWGSNTLYSLLNTYYYASDATKMNGQSHAGCYGYYTTYNMQKQNCDYTEIGILSSSYYGKMVRNVYWNVGAVSDSSTVVATAYTTETGTKSSVTGRIGLMNASDYGYATSGITYSSVGLSSLVSYTQNNWLFVNRGEFTLTPRSTSNVWGVYLAVLDDGVLASTGSVYGGTHVRPVVYLDSSVYIISGDGTEGNPYQIRM